MAELDLGWVSGENVNGITVEANLHTTWRHFQWLLFRFGRNACETRRLGASHETSRLSHCLVLFWVLALPVRPTVLIMMRDRGHWHSAPRHPLRRFGL